MTVAGITRFLKPAGLLRPARLMCALLFMLAVAGYSGSALAASCSGAGSPCFGDGPTFKPGTCSDAGVCMENADKDGTCTSNPVYNPKTVEPGKGIVATIIKDVKNTLKPMSRQMFEGISSDNGFRRAATAAATLFVIIYAVAFLFGMVQLTAYDFMIRMFKLSVVAMLLDGSAWGRFSDTVVKFFQEGTDSLITQVSTIAIAGTTLGGEPFDWMDNAILQLTSTKMLLTLMAAATTGPYGAVAMAILMIALYNFVKSMLNALWVYLMALVLRTLLFGLAPLFLTCVLFSRTRPLFDGWLNQVVNTCLQPVFLFTFFAFFVQLIKTALEQILQTTVCWTEMPGADGAASSTHNWRFALWSCSANRWEPFDGVWGFNGPDNVNFGFVTNKSDCGKPVPVHPLGIMLPLTIWILADLAKRFNEIVTQIAKNIANASTSFEYRGQGFGGEKVTGGGNAGGGAARPAAGAGRPGGAAGGGGSAGGGIVGEFIDKMRGAGSPVGVRQGVGGAGSPPAGGGAPPAGAPAGGAPKP